MSGAAILKLPSWNFEADIVNPRTMFVVMPYFPEDLKRVFKMAQRQGQEFGDLRCSLDRCGGSLSLSRCIGGSRGVVAFLVRRIQLN